MTKPYDTLITALTVLPQGEALYSEMATKIYLDDEAAGLFVVVEQTPDKGEQAIRICPEDWQTIRAAINRLMGMAKKRNEPLSKAE